MRTHTRRQRAVLYAGIADMPLPGVDDVIGRFNYGFTQKPHSAMIYLLYDLHRLQTRSVRRPLPGILAAA